MTSPKATATATVSNGSASTSNITYNQQLTPGTYTITAEYAQNMTYESSNGTGTLTINKADTTTSISLSENTATEGDAITITVVTTTNGTALNTGVIKIYDNNALINTVNVDSTSTNISYTCSVTGSHTLYAVWVDTTGNYNNSTSSTAGLTVESNKKTVTSIQIMVNTASSGFFPSRTLFAAFKDSNGNPITLDTSKFSESITMNTDGYYGNTFYLMPMNVNYSGDTGVNDFSFKITNTDPYMQLL